MLFTSLPTGWENLCKVLDEQYRAINLRKMASPAPLTRVPQKRLIICCDGTFNDSVSTNDPLTNVSRLSRCIDDVGADGTPQIVYYHTGIGSGTSKFSNLKDAATGRGEAVRIECFKWTDKSLDRDSSDHQECLHIHLSES